MSRKQVIVQRTREFFGERLDQVLKMVQQDRQDLHGWQEPAHLRAVLRRAVREEGTPKAEQMAAVATEISREAGEPDKGQQREALGQILEAGAVALDNVRSSQVPELTPDEQFGLECVVLLYGRPGLLVSQGRLAQGPAFWNVLEDQRDDIELTQRGVGRIELLGHPEYDWAGTGFLVGDTTVMTTRRTAELFAEDNGSGQWQFRPGISAWMNYQADYQEAPSAACRIQSILGVHEKYNLAILQVEPPQQSAGAPVPVALAAHAPQNLEGRPVYLVGYPARDARRGEPEAVARIFRDAYNVKRVQPGVLRGMLQFRDISLLQHDCAMLGHSEGSCLIDLETHQVLGLHLTNRYLETGVAIPLWALRDDPLLQRGGVTFAGGDAQEMKDTIAQMERLVRTRHWAEVRAAISTLHERAFGKNRTEESAP